MNPEVLLQLSFIFSQFNIGSDFISYKELASGHINDTYLITTSKKPDVILQRINEGVFKDVPGLIKNKVMISEHLQKKLSHLPKSERDRKVLTFIPAKDGLPFYNEKSGNYWNMMVYIEDSITYETVLNEAIAYEGGKLIGGFLNLTSDFDANLLIEVIPKFHDMTFRFSQFEDALKIASPKRLHSAFQEIKNVWKYKNEMHLLQQLKESGKLKERVTHNDTKIANILFDKNNKGLCVIDTDTVMSGIVHYDFGDAIRTICNTAAEDEKNLEKVHFNITFYKAYKKGFLEEIKDNLTPTELEHLPLSAKTMIFIMALRFLTDYLNNDIYYKTDFEDHNLVRSKNQFKLLESFNLNMT
jgi:serine/threonine protein kinase